MGSPPRCYRPRSQASRDDPDSSTRVAREINEDFATLIGEHPDRFGAAAVLLRSPDAALTEIPTHWTS
jgi:hypothetical protein